MMTVCWRGAVRPWRPGPGGPDPAAKRPGDGLTSKWAKIAQPRLFSVKSGDSLAATLSFSPRPMEVCANDPRSGSSTRRISLNGRGSRQLGNQQECFEGIQAGQAWPVMYTDFGLSAGKVSRTIFLRNQTDLYKHLI